MKSIIELLKWIQDNWASIITIIVLLIGIYTRAKKFITDWNAKTKEEKEMAEQIAFNKAVESAKSALADYILILVSKAEIDWKSEEGKLGQTKRAQVIEEIYKKYPVLEQVTDRDQLLAYIDELINKALKVVREELREPARTLEEKIIEQTIEEVGDMND